MTTVPGSVALLPTYPSAPRARSFRARLVLAGCAFTLPALLLGGLMFVGSAEAEPATEKQVPVSATVVASTAPESAPAPKQPEVTQNAPKAEKMPTTPKARKHRLLPVKDYGGY